MDLKAGLKNNKHLWMANGMEGEEFYFRYHSDARCHVKIKYITVNEVQRGPYK